MADEATEELDSTIEPSEEDANTEDIEDADAESVDEDGKPKYTESEMKSFARAKKAEADVKRLKAEKAELLKKVEAKNKLEIKQDSKPKENDGSVDEKILRATKGYDDDAIDELKFIAERNGISLFAAEQDKRFVRYKQIADEDKKKAEAGMGASKGAGRKKVEPDFADPDLTPEQHEQIWNKKMGL